MNWVLQRTFLAASCEWFHLWALPCLTLQGTGSRWYASIRVLQCEDWGVSTQKLEIACSYMGVDLQLGLLQLILTVTHFSFIRWSLHLAVAGQVGYQEWELQCLQITEHAWLPYLISTHNLLAMQLKTVYTSHHHLLKVDRYSRAANKTSVDRL